MSEPSSSASDNRTPASAGSRSSASDNRTPASAGRTDKKPYARTGDVVRGLGRGIGTATPTHCPVSVIGTHDEGSRRDGRCTWCEYQFTGPAPRPYLGPSYRTELDREYRRTYDPDYEADYWDT